MPTSQSQVDYFREILAFVPELQVRKMFGEWGLYTGLDADKKFFGMICDSRLFLKATPSLQLLITDDGLRAYEGAGNGYYHIDESNLEDGAKLVKLIQAAFDFVPPVKKTSKPKP